MTPGPPRPHGDRSEALRCWTARAPGRRPLAGRRGAPRTMRDPRCREDRRRRHTPAPARPGQPAPIRRRNPAREPAPPPPTRGWSSHAGFTLDDQSRGARGCRLQELGHGPELLRTAHHAGTHDSPIVSANPEFTDQVPGEQFLACLTGQVDESFSDHKTERLQSYWQLQRAVGSGVVASALHGSTTGLCLIRVPTSPESRWCGRPAWSQVLETRSNESALNTP